MIKKLQIDNLCLSYISIKISKDFNQTIKDIYREFKNSVKLDYSKTINNIYGINSNIIKGEGRYYACYIEPFTNSKEIIINGTFVSLTHKGEYFDIKNSYTKLLKYIKDNNLKIRNDKFSFEHYLNYEDNLPREKLLVDIFIAINN